MGKDTIEVGELGKLHINGEGFWARKLGDNRYEVRNTLICNDFTCGDVIDRHGNVLVRKSRMCILLYEVPPREDIAKVFPRLAKHFEDHDVRVEGYLAGTAGLTVPLSLNDDELDAIVEAAPTQCKLGMGDE